MLFFLFFCQSQENEVPLDKDFTEYFLLPPPPARQNPIVGPNFVPRIGIELEICKYRSPLETTSIEENEKRESVSATANFFIERGFGEN